MAARVFDLVDSLRYGDESWAAGLEGSGAAAPDALEKKPRMLCCLTVEPDATFFAGCGALAGVRAGSTALPLMIGNECGGRECFRAREMQRRAHTEQLELKVRTKKIAAACGRREERELDRVLPRGL